MTMGGLHEGSIVAEEPETVDAPDSDRPITDKNLRAIERYATKRKIGATAFSNADLLRAVREARSAIREAFSPNTLRHFVFENAAAAANFGFGMKEELARRMLHALGERAGDEADDEGGA